MPPLWMVFETTSFGTVSIMFSGLPRADQKRIADKINLPVPALKSWLKSASYVRNLCAHHSRLWNKIFTLKPMIINKYRDDLSPNNKFYAQAISLHLLLQEIFATEPEIALQSMKNFYVHNAVLSQSLV